MQLIMAKGALRNLLGVVADGCENDLCTIAVKGGILQGNYSFTLCLQQFLTNSDITMAKKLSMREAVKQNSASGGQGFVKCDCNGAKNCQSKRCRCFKAALKCNSLYHSGLNYKNN